MAKMKTPKSVKDRVRPKSPLGVGSILAQSGIVADAFGPRLGFALMVLGLLVAALASGGAVLVIFEVAARFP